MHLLLAIVTACVWGTRAQVLFKGECPSVTVQRNFNLTRYMGRWYEVERYFTAFELGSKCVTADYTLEVDGSVIVNNTGYSRRLMRYSSGLGTAVVTDPENPAKLGVRFNPDQQPGDYWVLSTDYDTFAIVWSCSQFRIPFIGVKNAQLLWILMRQRELLTAPMKMSLYSTLQGFNINTNFLRARQVTNCP